MEVTTSVPLYQQHVLMWANHWKVERTDINFKSPAPHSQAMSEPTMKNSHNNLNVQSSFFPLHQLVSLLASTANTTKNNVSFLTQFASSVHYQPRLLDGSSKTRDNNNIIPACVCSSQRSFPELDGEGGTLMFSLVLTNGVKHNIKRN